MSAAPSSSARVSVIVPAYGVAPMLGEALASLQTQTRSDWEAVVVDDGSPDEVASAFAPFSGDPRFRLLRTDNRGVATARNRAAAASGAPFLAFLDGDDRYAPDYLRRMLAVIETDPALGFVGCDALVFGEHADAGRLYSQRHPVAPPVSLVRVLRREVHVFTAAVVRRVAFEQVGGFDPRLEAAEDLDLWVRLLSAGWTAAVVDAPLARYRRRPGSLSASERRLLEGECAVYAAASAALAGRPEGEVAEHMSAARTRELRWLEGEEALRRGEAPAGLSLLADAGGRSGRWRVGLGVMRRAPALASILLRARAWLPRPGQDDAPRRAQTRAGALKRCGCGRLPPRPSPPVLPPSGSQSRPT